MTTSELFCLLAMALNTALCAVVVYTGRFQAKPLNAMLAQCEESFKFYRRQAQDFGRAMLVRDHPELGHTKLAERVAEDGVQLHSEDLASIQDANRKAKAKLKAIEELEERYYRRKNEEELGISPEGRGAYQEVTQG